MGQGSPMGPGCIFPKTYMGEGVVVSSPWCICLATEQGAVLVDLISPVPNLMPKLLYFAADKGLMEGNDEDHSISSLFLSVLMLVLLQMFAFKETCPMVR